MPVESPEHAFIGLVGVARRRAGNRTMRATGSGYIDDGKQREPLRFRPGRKLPMPNTSLAVPGQE
jgi:hypothetical protein